MKAKNTLFWVLGIAGLTLTLVPSLLVFAGKISFEQHKTWMLLGMILWFAAAPTLTRRQAGS
jgi:hypothetical protein